MRTCYGSVVNRAFAVLALTAAVAGSAHAQKTSPTPRPADPGAATAALERAVARYSDGSAHSAAFVQIYTPSGFATARREAGTVVIQTPQRVRFDYTAPEKKIFTYDSGEGRFFSPEDKQLTVRRLSEDEKSRLPVVFLRDPADLGRQYEITVDPADPSGISRVLLTPRVGRPELAWLRLAIDKDGSVRELSYQDTAGNKTEFRFEAWQKGKARPAADFRITGPPGTRIVEN